MECRFMIDEPSEIEATMKITMPIKEWEELREQLQQAYPAWRLSAAISDLLSQARKVFYEEHKTT